MDLRPPYASLAPDDRAQFTSCSDPELCDGATQCFEQFTATSLENLAIEPDTPKATRFRALFRGSWKRAIALGFANLRPLPQKRE